MWASFRAEWLKLRKRPAVQVLVLLVVGIMIFFNYALPYWLYQGAQGGVTIWGGIAEQDLLDILPGNLVQQTVFGSFVAGILTLILGVLVAGSEYGWGTLKTVLTRRPGRVAVYGGKVLALGVMVTMIVLAIFAAAATASALVAATEGEVAQQASAPDIAVRINQVVPFGETYAEQEAARIAEQLARALQWPPALEIVKAIAALWLILAIHAAFGLFLGTLARGTALAISLGLVWLQVVEAYGMDRARFGRSIHGIVQWLIGANTNSLAVSFIGERGLIEMSATRAVLVLSGYTLLFIALGALFFRRRDVT
jgi:ABC-type transport system involved in multi-copper enzyme maturation permease subunit